MLLLQKPKSQFSELWLLKNIKVLLDALSKCIKKSRQHLISACCRDAHAQRIVLTESRKSSEKKIETRNQICKYLYFNAECEMRPGPVIAYSRCVAVLLSCVRNSSS